ncbi:hypothetical protein, partial [Nocardia sp. NPDC058497]|uniref:hypothetical protein n=1 Tax=Nocardia sp. NPDC058497 TaxID=3346529 RepID=UPI003667660E
DTVTILDDRTDTFLAAGKAYKDTDTGGKADLAALRTRIESNSGKADDLGKRPDPRGLSTQNDRLHMKANEKTAQPDWKEVNTLSKDNWGLPPSLVGKNGLKFDPMKPKPENMDQYSHDQLVAVENSIMQGSPAMPIVLAQAAADWHWLAGKLEEKFNALSTAMVNSANKWTSPGKTGGADRARAAITTYGTENDNLVASMKAVGDGLEYVSEWLYTTGVEMVQVSQTPIPRKDNESDPVYKARAEEECRKGHVKALDDNYVPGLKATSDVIAILPDPISPTTGTNPTGTGPTGTNSTGGSGGSSGSGSGSNAGLSSAFQQQMAALAAQQSAAQQSAGQQSAGQQTNQSGQNGSGSGSGSSSSGLEQLTSALSSGMEQASSAAQSALEQAASAAEQSSALSSVPGLAGISSAVDEAKKAMSAAAKGGGGGGKGGGGAGAGGAGAGLGQNLQNAATLFPRASVSAATGAEALASRAGLASSGSPMGGMPMAPMGGAGAGGQGQQKEHKRADYLD